MDTELNKITINGQTYVLESNVLGSNQLSEKLDGMEYVIVRTYSAGVFAGYLKERVGQEVTLINARRLWYWKGAATLSQLSQEGVKEPAECKFPQEVPYVKLLQAIEILPVSKKAKESIAGVTIWKN